jgi:hypothetical protein
MGAALNHVGLRISSPDASRVFFAAIILLVHAVLIVYLVSCTSYLPIVDEEDFFASPIHVMPMSDRNGSGSLPGGAEDARRGSV